MGTYDQEITAIEEQIERNEMPAAEDVLWLCRNLRETLDVCKRWEDACANLHTKHARDVRIAATAAREIHKTWRRHVDETGSQALDPYIELYPWIRDDQGGEVCQQTSR